MATTKTLRPTNVTISIPEFTDQPDQRVNSNCIDKEADAINTLSEHLEDLHNSTAISNVNLNDYKTTKTYRIGNLGNITNAPSGIGTSGVFLVDAYGAYITQKLYMNAGNAVRLSYDSGTTWNSWDIIALNSNHLKTYQYEPSFTIRANQTGAINVGTINTITGGLVNSSNFKNVAINFPGIALIPLTDSSITILYVYVLAAPPSDVTKTLQVTFFYT